MLLVRYDSGVSIPAFCSVSDNARDAFVATPRNGPPFSVLFLLLLLPPRLSDADFIQRRCHFARRTTMGIVLFVPLRIGDG